MAFRNAATTVVARVFKLLDSNGFTRILLAALTRTGFAGYALLYDDPAYNLATEGAGLWFRDGSTDPQTQLFASQVGTVEAYVDVNTIEAFSESAVNLVALSAPKTTSISVISRPALSQINITCDVLGTWTNVAGGVGFTGGWANTGGALQVCQYKLVGDLVIIRGDAVNAAGAGGATTIFTLPAGRRPPATINYYCSINGGAGGFTIQINAAGQVIYNGGCAAGTTVGLNIILHTST